jgi:hypothetical protein
VADNKDDQYQGDLEEILGPPKKDLPKPRRAVPSLSVPPLEKQPFFAADPAVKTSRKSRVREVILETIIKVAVIAGVIALFVYYARHGIKV